MFGIAVASLSSLSEEEKKDYSRAYCGLCHSLKRTFGAISRLTLSYDLTFLEIFYNSLYEPRLSLSQKRCPAHPTKKVESARSGFSDYCAMLSVAMAYHKCLDDIADDRSIKAMAASKALKSSYAKAKREIPAQCSIIEEAMFAIRELESSDCPPPDAASIVFGEMLSFCIECCPEVFPDNFSPTLADFGFWLGRFIYMMDAAVDVRQDLKSGSYNPFVGMGSPDDPEFIAFMRDTLSVLANNAVVAFERLPIIDNVHLLRCILYQGVWQKFNMEYEQEGE